MRQESLSGLEGGVARALRRADASGRPQWLVLRAPVEARDFLETLWTAPESDRFYWEHPAAGLQLAALGAAHEIAALGPGRIAAVAQEAKVLLGDVHRVGATEAAPWEPLLVGGFSFSDDHVAEGDWQAFPAARLVLPERVFARRADRAVCRIAQRVAPGADASALVAGLRERVAAGLEPGRPHREAGRPPASFHAEAEQCHDSYEAGVADALRAIAAGDLEKVVLARSVRLARDAGFDPAAVLERLRRRHESCASFALAHGGDALVGATPELLVRLEAGRVHTMALAGSAPRGRSPEEDARLARELVESKKEQAEHAVVVVALREGIAPLCHEVVQPEAPRLRRLEGIQHLETPVEGRARGDALLLDLVARLHPTPAVGGTPRRDALDWIARHEPLRRGWYAGPVGFVNDAGGGEMRVALRCALLRAETAHLFAGAGIVAGSQPAAELRETRLKLAAMLGALVEL